MNKMTCFQGGDLNFEGDGNLAMEMMENWGGVSSPLRTMLDGSPEEARTHLSNMNDALPLQLYWYIRERFIYAMGGGVVFEHLDEESIPSKRDNLFTESNFTPEQEVAFRQELDELYAQLSNPLVEAYDNAVREFVHFYHILCAQQDDILRDDLRHLFFSYMRMHRIFRGKQIFDMGRVETYLSQFKEGSSAAMVTEEEMDLIQVRPTTSI